MASTKLFALLCLCVMMSVVMGFRSFAHPRLHKMHTLRMSADGADQKPKVSKLVPADQVENVNAAAVTGGVLGFVLGGPVLGVTLAAVSNYVAKNDNEPGEALRGFGKVVVDSYNFLNKVNNKYGLTGKATKAVSDAVNSAASDNDAIEKLKASCSSAVDKLDELNKEYDLVTKGKEVVVAAATLSDSVIDKAIELNDKYDFVKKATQSVVSAVEKVADQAKKTD